jgi:alkylation response protein AidB-like acyl-CoA dehydrogenase
VLTISSLPTDLAAFADEVDAFLAGRLPRRDHDGTAVEADVIEVHGLEHRPDDEAAGAVAAAAQWQAERFDAGLGWITGPPGDGGRGLPSSFERLYWEREAEYLAPDLTPLNVGTKMLSAAIVAHGSDAIRRQYLPALHRGDLIGCQLFSEPDAGSDLAAVRTTATWREGVWTVAGEKVWASKAQFSDLGLCLARTSPSEETHRGLTMFLVDMHDPGVEVRPLRQMNAHASFNQVLLDGVLVPDSHRLGEVGDGWSVVRTTLMSERAGVGRGASDPAAVALDRMIALVHRLGRGGDPLLRQGLADLYSRVRVADFIRQRGQAAEQRGVVPAPGAEGSINKLVRTRNLQRAAALIGRVLGPRLLVDEPAWMDFVLCAPGIRLGGGTDEIQRTVLAERVLGLPREPRQVSRPLQ